ncbi:hypothetical protein ACH5RR_004929 [Cinchona calisaya]|uniref:Uncharacterized protein n=1 Tax=Cinchona calisaya TaxID=153742 RepID=A0ABD3AZ17_9GENT
MEYQCRTSEVVVGMAENIETDECLSACGVDRNAVGISSDAFFESLFAAKFSVPLVTRTALTLLTFTSIWLLEKIDEVLNRWIDSMKPHSLMSRGVYLPALCEKQRSNPHRAMIEHWSNGAAPGPVAPQSDDLVADAPASSPFSF